MATVEQVASSVSVSSQAGGPLDRQVTDDHVLDVCDFMTEWQTVASRLKVSDADLADIKEENATAKKRKEMMLKAWISAEDDKATYRTLGAVFIKMKKVNLARKVFVLAGANVDGDPPSHDLHNPHASSVAVNGCSNGVASTRAEEVAPRPRTVRGGHDMISQCLSQSGFSASSAWDLKRLKKFSLDGSETVIAILDTAISYSYPAFKDKNIKFYNYHGQEVLISSVEGKVHGSVCAAIAVGSPFDTFPGGIAPGAQLIVFEIAHGDNDGLAALNALNYIIRHNDELRVDVVSVSQDLPGSISSEISSRIERLTEMDILFVAAAGNRGNYQRELCVPACFDKVISVGALDKNGNRSCFNPDCDIDVYAPGENIIDLDNNGTSFAAPAIAGLVLLLKQIVNKVLQRYESEEQFLVAFAELCAYRVVRKHAYGVVEEYANAVSPSDSAILQFSKEVVETYTSPVGLEHSVSVFIKKHVDQFVEQCATSTPNSSVDAAAHQFSSAAVQRYSLQQGQCTYTEDYHRARDKYWDAYEEMFQRAYSDGRLFANDRVCTEAGDDWRKAKDDWRRAKDDWKRVKGQIHKVEVLKAILTKHMSGDQMKEKEVLEPVSFLLKVAEGTVSLTDIVHEAL